MVNRCALLGLVSLFWLASAHAHAADDDIMVFANDDVKLRLSMAGRDPLFLNGSVSFDIRLRREASGTVVVQDFYVVVFDFPYSAVVKTWKHPGRRNATQGFTLATKPQTISFDEKSGVISGQLPIRASFPLAYFNQTTSAPPQDNSLAIQHGTLSVLLNVNTSFEQLMSGNKSSSQYDMRLTLALDEQVAIGIAGYIIGASMADLRVWLAKLLGYSSLRQLCLQPVVLGANGTTTGNDGNSLACGLQVARQLWGKRGEANKTIRFHVKETRQISPADFPTVADLIILDESEIYNSFPEVDEKCIEIFFVSRFSKEPCFMGGALTAPAIGDELSYVVVSDELLANCNQINAKWFLAHELGHVMNFDEANSDDVLPAHRCSQCTVMCARGCVQNNPNRNSRHNISAADNPLFRIGFWPFAAPPADCGDADCGSSCDCPY